MAESRSKRRWFHLSPDRLIIGLLAVEVFLVLSERFQWFAFNEKKGWTVLIAVAAVCVVVVVMLVWLVVSLPFRWRFQFSLRSLVVLVVAVAVPLGWFGVKLREAERQRRAVEAIKQTGGWVCYDYQRTPKVVDRYVGAELPAPARLRELVGDDFFAEVIGVSLFPVFSAPHRKRAALPHVRALTKLEWVCLDDMDVTKKEVEELCETLGHRHVLIEKARWEETNLDQP